MTSLEIRRTFKESLKPRDADMVEELRELMNDAKDDRTRQEFKRFIEKLESM